MNNIVDYDLYITLGYGENKVTSCYYHVSAEEMTDVIDTYAAGSAYCKYEVIANKEGE